MKVELNKAYVDLELLKAEVSGRSADAKKLEKVWLVFSTTLCLISLSPVLLIIFKADWHLPQAQEISTPAIKVIASVVPIAPVSDDEAEMGSRQPTETLIYPATKRAEAIAMAEMKGVPLVYMHDLKGRLEYHVTYPVNIRVESYSDP
jgi:hypothetical protein